MNAAFRDLIRDNSPPWLRRTWGERYLYAFGLILDGIADWMIKGMAARFPDAGLDDALPFIGRDRRIRRGFAEPADHYRARLKAWKSDAKTCGTALALMKQIQAYCYGFDIRVRCVNDRGSWQQLDADGTYTEYPLVGNWDWDGKYPTEAKTRFWVIIYPLDSGIWEPHGHYGDGQRWGEPGRTWGTTATRDQVQTIRQIVAEWSPLGARCPYIIIAFDPDSFDPTAPPGAPLPDGTWGKWYKDSSGVAVRSRLSTARYWRGPQYV
jgi:hypothetical protein